MPLDDALPITLLRWLGRALIFVCDILFWEAVWGFVQLVLGVIGVLTAWAITLGQSSWTPDEPRSQIVGGLVMAVAGCLLYWSLL